MRCLLSLGITSVLLSPSFVEARDSAPLSASDAGGDGNIKVWCSDGAFYRGEPLEVVPKDHVTLRLHDGKTVRLEWSKITGVDGLRAMPNSAKPQQKPVRSNVNDEDDVEKAPSLRPRQGEETPRQPAQWSPPVQPQIVSNQAPIATDTVVTMPIPNGTKPVQVRFTGMKEGAIIEYLANSAELNGWSWGVGYLGGTADTWQAVCILPCRLNADPNRRLRVSGAKITTSSGFFLPTRGDRFEVEIKPGWKGTRTAAWAMLITGAALATLGAATLAFIPTEGKVDANNPALIGGSVLIGTGVLAALIGGPLMAKSSTDVEIFRE